MDFKSRPIRHHKQIPKSPKPLPENQQSPKLSAETTTNQKPHPNPQSKTKDLQLKHQLITILGGIFILLILLFLIFQVIKSLDFSNLIFSFGQNLQTDEKGSTNILLMGVGGEGHDGSNLTDTLLVASIDYKNKLVPMLSIPRDLFVSTTETGKSKINSVYAYGINKYGRPGAVNILKETVSKIIGLPIQYYIKIDFAGFEKIVDSLGGIDIYVEKSIYDTEFPKGETTGYETFSIKAGLQHLDGITALKYARSRHTSSDYDRAKRQQELLYAIKEKALSLNILTDPSKIQALYNSISQSIDTNLSLPEIIELAKVSKDYGKESVFPIVLNDDPTACGGLVYTPDRSYFADASVALLAGNSYDYLHFFVTTVFKNIKPLLKQDQIQVLNATKTAGLAYEGMSALSRFCLNVVYYANAKDRNVDLSTLYYKPNTDGSQPEIIPTIQTLMPGLTLKEGIPEEYLSSPKRANSNIVIELGKNYLSQRLPDPFDSLKYLPPLLPKTTQETTTYK